MESSHDELRMSKRRRKEVSFGDDMLIFGTSLSMVHSTKRFLASQFDMKDIGEAKVILGVKIIRMSDSIMLS